MIRTIGIVACSAEGAALCYRTICGEAPARLGPHAHPTVVLHGASFADYVERLDRGDLEGVAERMLDSARALALAGADFLICPDNTIHEALPLVRVHSPLAWLSIAEAVADAAEAGGRRRLGLMGTAWLVSGPVYPDVLDARGIAWRRPSDEDREVTHRIIMEELVRGVVRPESVTRLQRVIERFAADGCDAVVLGCTELPLVLHDGNSALPTLDSTRLLARAAIRRALEPQPPARSKEDRS